MRTDVFEWCDSPAGQLDTCPSPLAAFLPAAVVQTVCKAVLLWVGYRDAVRAVCDMVVAGGQPYLATKLSQCSGDNTENTQTAAQFSTRWIQKSFGPRAVCIYQERACIVPFAVQSDFLKLIDEMIGAR